MFTMNDIIKDDHPNIRKGSKTAKIPLSKSDKLLARKLLEFVINSQDKAIREKYHLIESVGIAAPQVNILKRMFALHFVDFRNQSYSMIVINPEIVKKSKDYIYLENGEDCLSVPEKRNQVTLRHMEIAVNGYFYNPFKDELEYRKNVVFHDYPAIVFQHEYDHTDGILYIDKLTNDIPSNAISLSDYVKSLD